MIPAYVVQVALLTFFYASRQIRLPLGFAVYALALGLTQSAAVIAGLIVTGDINPLDIAVAMSKVMSATLLFGLAAGLRANERDVHRIMQAVIGLAVAAILWGLLDLGNPLATLTQIGSSYEVNFRGFLGNRNQLGSLVFLSIVAHFVIRATKRWSFRAASILAVQGVGLLLTMSRGAVFATVIFLLAYFLLKRSLLWGMVGALAAGLTLFGLLDLVPDSMDVLQRLFIREDAGLSGRDLLWAHGLEIFSLSPLVGVGAFQALDVATGRGMTIPQFHSFYIETLAGGGILELALVLGALFYTGLLAFRSARRDPVARVYVAAFVGLAFLATFESVGFLSIGYVDTLFGVLFLTVPISMFPRKKDSLGISRSSLPVVKELRAPRLGTNPPVPSETPPVGRS
ncbi:O-antigen ligase [Tessaracoccus sp. MC1756]|uniref:O-antigen ligase family protein n=1 Tax=Tessaracoccus sp. MC1756 TaxID=2760311 RepID=UPI001600669E|nr:O-antigen ligase family protein [Tessaracoccus sp. MC1756]MBB1509826.1 O-antigen ligase family protein [Tessaracoccus sp. MC1756]